MVRSRRSPCQMLTLLQCATALLGLALLSCAVRADNTLVPEQAQAKQQQIQSQAQQVKDEIGTIITEYQNNGLGASDDVAMLKSIQGALDGLSRDQMQQVLTLLAAARQESDPAKVRSTLLATVQKQNEITLRLQQQLLQSQRQQDLAAIALRFSQLAERQHANLRMLARYNRLAVGATVFTLNLTQKQYLQTQVTEQEMIADEVRQELERVADLTHTVDSATALRLATMQQEVASDRLVDRLQVAGDELTGNQTGFASLEERAIRDTLRQLARLGAPPPDSLQMLRSSGQDMARMIQQEQSIIASAGEMAKSTDLAADTSIQTEEQQADLVDDADELARDLADLDPEVSGLLASVLLKMQQTRASLLAKSPDEILEHATHARADLQAALARLTLTLNRLEKLATAQLLPDKVAALTDSIEALRRDEEQLAALTADTQAATPMSELSLRQAALARTARDLLPFAGQANGVPALLASAAQEMDHATLALGSLADPAKSQSDELAAISSLKNAEILLHARASQLAAAKKELDDFEAARHRLVTLILQQEHLAVEMAQVDAQSRAILPGPPIPATASVVPAASRESDIHRAAGEVQQALAARVAPADAALDTAASHLAAAALSLTASDAHATLPPARLALADLNAARQALDPQINDLRKLLELPDDPFNALDDLARSIDQITHDLTQPPDSQRQALVALRDQQRQIASDLADLAAQDSHLKAAATGAEDAGERLDQGHVLDAARDARTVLDQLNSVPDKPQSPAIASLVAREEGINAALSNIVPSADHAAAPAASATEPASAPDSLPVSAAQAAQLAGDTVHAQIMDRGAMPASANEGLSTAEQALANASAQAAAGDQSAAKASRSRALQALQRAQGAVAAAQQSREALTSQNPTPSQAETSTQSGSRKPSNQNQPGQPTAVKLPGPGQSDTGDAKDDHNNASPMNAHAGAQGASSVIQLPPRDRAAIEQSRREQPPQEYAPMVENYFKNLSEERE